MRMQLIHLIITCSFHVLSFPRKPLSISRSEKFGFARVETEQGMPVHIYKTALLV